MERNELAGRLIREPGAGPSADLVDRLTLDADLRRLFARLLGELEAAWPRPSRGRSSPPH